MSIHGKEGQHEQILFARKCNLHKWSLGWIRLNGHIDINKEFTEYKVLKSTEEKEVKTKQKKLIQKKEAQIKIEKSIMENSKSSSKEDMKQNVQMNTWIMYQLL